MRRQNNDIWPEVESRIWGKRWIRWAAIWLIWTFVGLVFTLQYYFASYRSERPVGLGSALYLQMTWSFVWALATPLVLSLAARLPIERTNWLRNSSLHLVACVVLSVVLTAAGFVLLYVNWGWREGKPFSFERMARFVVGNFSEAVGMYLLIALAAYAFNYYKRYRQGELRALQLEAQLSQAQLQALKMQLHPHFLFNTLHSISALLNRDSESARTMITRLGDFLRLTLENSGTQEVSLQQEMEFLQCYLEIERVRFQDRLITKLEVEPEALDARVPNLILQPIVENAIRHGVAPRSTPGVIEIQVKPHNGTLRIQVRDNGPGLASHRTADSLFTRGLGLSNTQSRLDRLYGPAHRFELNDNPDGGLVVTLEIPFKRDGAPTSEADESRPWA